MFVVLVVAVFFFLIKNVSKQVLIIYIWFANLRNCAVEQIFVEESTIHNRIYKNKAKNMTNLKFRLKNIHLEFRLTYLFCNG